MKQELRKQVRKVASNSKEARKKESRKQGNKETRKQGSKGARKQESKRE